jgi:hypothetical protein
MKGPFANVVQMYGLKPVPFKHARYSQSGTLRPFTSH